MVEKGLGYESIEACIFEFLENGNLEREADNLVVLARMWQMGNIGMIKPSDSALATHIPTNADF